MKTRSNELLSLLWWVVGCLGFITFVSTNSDRSLIYGFDLREELRS